MKNFRVLDRSLKLHQNYLLEASAGTGKTFSIQNIVVRLLIESCGYKDPITLPEILVVTFTKAAARDLKLRIRANIEQAIDFLQQDPLSGRAPDYLKALMERGEADVRSAIKCLQQALFTFDDAQIFTIHSFCSRMLNQFALESDMGFQARSSEESFPKSELIRVVRDFFRTEIRLESYSPVQLEIMLKQDLQKKLVEFIQKGYDFAPYPAFKQVHTEFSALMLILKKEFALSSEKMIEDFTSQAGSYRNWSSETKTETLDKVIRFARLFDQDEWSVQELDGLISDGLAWVKALDSQLLKKGKSAALEKLHYPLLTQKLEKTLDPLIAGACDYSVLLARMAGDCRKLLIRYQQEEEKLSPDDVLRKMDGSLNQPLFRFLVQSNYQAAIVDEFQDTDPLQWSIFKRLFISENNNWKGHVYLVGDPKQSIYSFRQADIYTYLAAAQALGEEHCCSLNVNYRSQPLLVQALNTLFASENLPHFIPLPKTSSHLAYQPVQSAKHRAEFEDERGAIHFFIADGQAFKKPKLDDFEEDVFFPFIVQEMIRLRKHKGMAFRQFAVLVRDSYQALRLADFFDRAAIPYLNQKAPHLADSPALQALIDMIRAVLRPQDRGAIRTALGSPLMGWTHAELMNDPCIEKVLFQFQLLRICLLEKGFAAFFQEMLQTICLQVGEKAVHRILSRERGLEFYRDLQQIADIVVENQYLEWNSPEGIVPFLDQFQMWAKNEDERGKRFQDPSTEGVRILTLHMSKGLEFDVVFALGLVKRSEIKDDLIPVEREGRTFLSPATANEEDYRRFCEESDAEKMRLLYVALTRAKQQLYIPAALHWIEDLKAGGASPMDLFLARLGKPKLDYPDLYQVLKNEWGKNLIDFLVKEGKHPLMTYSLHQEPISEFPREEPMDLPNDLHPPEEVLVPGKAIYMTSFSSLSHQAEYRAAERTAMPSSSPKNYESHIKDVNTLPANSETGLLIHRILETAAFDHFRTLQHPSQAVPFIRPYIQKTPFKKWETAIADLVYHALKISLPQVDGAFCLAEIEPGQFYREMPFLFSHLKEEAIEEISFQEGLVKGVIDLFFQHKGFYYLVDWKTNWLAPQSEAYQRPLLEAAMAENAYFLQGSIYASAMKRFLKLVEPRPFEECFGGCFYLFLRGMQPGKDTGIYYWKP